MGFAGLGFRIPHSEIHIGNSQLLHGQHLGYGLKDKDLPPASPLRPFRASLLLCRPQRLNLKICASCKKIRDDKGSWQQLELYFTDHSEVQFSHGICPDCMKKLYDDPLKKKES